MTKVAERDRDASATPDRARSNASVVPASGMAFQISAALALTSAFAAALTLLVPDVLRGPAVMNGSARGTALVILAVAVPALLAAMRAASQGSARAVPVWLGVLGYLGYNAVLLLFATPFNALFLPYIAQLALAVWALAITVGTIVVERFGDRCSSRMPVRGLVAYLLVVVALNAAAWLVQIVPAMLRPGPPAFLAGTGLTTNPVFVLDLGVVLPLTTVAALRLLKREAWGCLVSGSLLAMLVIESLSVGVDQWLGHAADPASSVASGAMAPVFVAVAVAGLVPLAIFLRHVDRGET